MRRNRAMPVILGMNPPTKEVCLIKTDKPLNGYAILINHADFPEGTVRGDSFKDGLRNDIKRKGTACWLQFTDVDIMRLFAQNILDFLDMFEKGEQDEH